MSTKITTPVGIGDELRTTAAHGVTVRTSSVYDFTEDKFQSEINSEIGSIVLPWDTDKATTRSQIPTAQRKRNLIISYTTLEGKNITEKYIGTQESIVSEWASDSNWSEFSDTNSSSIKYSDSTVYPEGTIGKEIYDLKNTTVPGVASDLSTHEGDTSNPHNVTKSQVGLGNVNNTSDADKPVSAPQQQALNRKANITDIAQIWTAINGTQSTELKELEIWADNTCLTRPVDSSGYCPTRVYAQLWKNYSETTTYTDYIQIVPGEYIKYFPTGNSEEVGYTGSYMSAFVDFPGIIELTLDVQEAEEASILGCPFSFGNLINAQGGILDLLADHETSTNNPHNVTKAQVGLGNVDNTSDFNKPVSTATQNALDLKVNSSLLGVANGVATLDAGGKVPKGQLPTYLADDIAEYPSISDFPVVGETGKAYIDLSDSKIYRWSTNTNTYVETSAFAHDELDSKVDKVTGKGLSTEDYTTGEKTNLGTLWTNLGIVSFEEEGVEEVYSDTYIYNQTEIDNLLSLKASKSELNEYLSKFDEMYFMYGVEWNTSSTTPDLTRIGNLNLHKTLPVQSEIKPCLLNDDGEVVSYLPMGSWTGLTNLDGSEGQVMIELPKFFWKFETSGTKRRVKISSIPLSGYIECPKCYISAYEASLNRTSGKLSSVKNTGVIYRGGNNNTDYDFTYRSLLGRPVTGKTLSELRGFARNRGTGWNVMSYDIWKELYWLFVVEYATLDTQKNVNSTLTQDGYHQGGLGEGATQVIDFASWTNFNSNNPIIPCGASDNLGGGTGEVIYYANNASGNSEYTLKVNRYRGIENIFGHIWSWLDGIHVLASSSLDSRVYTCSDPTLWNDTTNESYSFVGNAGRESGWIKNIIFSNTGEIICSSIGGGNSIYCCDYYTTTIPVSGDKLYGVVSGGSLSDNLFSGLLCQGASFLPEIDYKNYVGTRLTYIP